MSHDEKTFERLRIAGDSLERELMKLHRNHHGENCDTCKALLDWWNATLDLWKATGR